MFKFRLTHARFRIGSACLFGAVLVAALVVANSAKAMTYHYKTKESLLACSGAPDHSVQRGNVEYLFYPATIRDEVLPTGSASIAAKERCETVVVLKDGVVVTADWHRSPDLLRAQLCMPRVNGCLW